MDIPSLKCFSVTYFTTAAIEVFNILFLLKALWYTDTDDLITSLTLGTSSQKVA